MSPKTESFKENACGMNRIENDLHAWMTWTFVCLIEKKISFFKNYKIVTSIVTCKCAKKETLHIFRTKL